MPRFGAKTVLAGVSLVTLGLNVLGGTCPAVGGGDSSVFGLIGFTGITVSYTPDGVNTCTLGLGPVLIPFAPTVIVLGFVWRPDRTTA